MTWPKATVRALHHHDEIELVAASGHTPSGHRRYTSDDVRHFYQVRSLRQRAQEVRTGQF
ncbi:MerR family transcriptional regulator [Lentzea albidocapillata]|uniref:MerR family transcriptional regulator n=1 Tax=Lentzea albidocapillata TaxID=40571 RepID=UPI0004C2CC14|nr:MerR family transcriptional regulator [Lentzea albidocapillata]